MSSQQAEVARQHSTSLAGMEARHSQFKTAAQREAQRERFVRDSIGTGPAAPGVHARADHVRLLCVCRGCGAMYGDHCRDIWHGQREELLTAMSALELQRDSLATEVRW